MNAWLRLSGDGRWAMGDAAAMLCDALLWFELSAGAPSKALWIMVTYDCDTGQSE